MLKVEGRVYRSIKDFWRKSNTHLCYDTLLEKVKGKSAEEKEGILKGILNGSNDVVILGIGFRSLNDASRFFGVDVNTSQVRRKRGWSVRDSILGKKPIKKLRKNVVARIVKDHLLKGYSYDEALQFFDGDRLIKELDTDAERAVNSFWDMCEEGRDPFEAYMSAFESVC